MNTAGPRGLVRVVLCDDHDLLRRGLAEMLTTADDIEVAGEADTHERAVAVVSGEKPDVVLLDLEIPGYTIEKRCLRKGGETVWVQLTSTLVRNASDDPITRWR